jgi:L-lactate utilization protein LutB
MIDETDLNDEKKWFYEQRAKMVITSMKRKNIEAQYAYTRNEALSKILELIPEKAVIGRGDSITIEETGVIQELEKRKHRIIDPMERTADGHFAYPDIKQRIKLAREVFSADVYLVGANAITLDGKIVNMDAWGNRVSAMIFGPEKVIIVAGVNKIVEDVEAALNRIHYIAAPMNAKRHYLKHHREEFATLPCVLTGKCVDCNHEWRLCHHTVIIDGTMVREKGRINVILVGEQLGI